MRRILAMVLLALVLSGCGSTVRHAISDRYAQASPQRIAVMPLVWEGHADPEAQEISYLFRKMASDKLRLLNYATVPFDEIEKGLSGRNVFSMKPHEVAALYNADSVLYIRLDRWDKDRLVTYASLSISAAFELHSATAGELWKAEYSTKESDIRLDGKPMELALIKAYEPRIERFIDAVFTTLPAGETRDRSRKTYFQWLP